MNDCQEYPGRLYDLCTGTGHDGRPDPPPEAIKHFAENRSLYPTTNRMRSMEPSRKSNHTSATVRAPEVTVSKIGSRLKTKFASWVGAIPCGNCKNEISRLNRLTPEEAAAARDEIINRIEMNAKTATMPWYSRLAAKADGMATGGLGAKFLIGMLLDESIEEERGGAIVD